MKHVEAIFDQFRQGGIRLTPVRKAVVVILVGAGKPISVAELTNRLATFDLMPNKTTLYREIAFLVDGGWIHGLDFGDGRKCYEWASEHHHHLVCRKCDRVEEVGVGRLEPAFAEFEKKLIGKSGFSGLGHSLEFFGLCPDCA